MITQIALVKTVTVVAIALVKIVASNGSLRLNQKPFSKGGLLNHQLNNKNHEKSIHSRIRPSCNPCLVRTKRHDQN